MSLNTHSSEPNGIEIVTFSDDKIPRMPAMKLQPIAINADLDGKDFMARIDAIQAQLMAEHKARREF